MSDEHTNPPVEYIELNLSNYDDADVAQLNEWAIWAAEYIEWLESRLNSDEHQR